MDKETALIIANNRTRIYDNYSGRGMNGKSTTGIIAEEQEDFFCAIAEVLENGFEDEQAVVAEALYNLVIDSYGTGIIYY